MHFCFPFIVLPVSEACKRWTLLLVVDFDRNTPHSGKLKMGTNSVYYHPPMPFSTVFQDCFFFFSPAHSSFHKIDWATPNVFPVSLRGSYRVLSLTLSALHRHWKVFGCDIERKRRLLTGTRRLGLLWKQSFICLLLSDVMRKSHGPDRGTAEQMLTLALTYE